uniref:Uncharacterized protein n=1 Tax=Anguilla anguilla TaxID=7936 RepID=A0A0E9U038_ANGAN
MLFNISAASKLLRNAVDLIQLCCWLLFFSQKI